MPSDYDDWKETYDRNVRRYGVDSPEVARLGPAPSTFKRLARFKENERAARVQPFIGKVCNVTYRRSGVMPYDEHVKGRVIGASYHRTNGNSTGDLVIVPVQQDNVWKLDDAEYNASSIALVHVGNIEVIG